MKTNDRQMCALLLAVALLGLFGLTSCADDEPEGDPTSSITSPNEGGLTCPTGQVPYRFPATQSTTSEQYASTTEGSSAATLPDYSEITISSVSCANGALYSEARLEQVRSRCNGQRSCEITSLCQQSCDAGSGAPGCTFSDATITYTCASDGGGTSGTRTATVDARAAGSFLNKNSLSCRGVNEDLSTANAKAGQVACIPSQCHGRARRNADMECVVDASKVEVVVSAEIGEIKPLIETMDRFGKQKLADARKQEETRAGRTLQFPEPMPIYGTFEIPIKVQFANELIPDEVKFTAWLETYDPNGDNWNYDPYFFRCVAFGFTIKKDDPYTVAYRDPITNLEVRTYDKVIRTKFSEDCAPAAAQQHFFKLLDRSDANASGTYQNYDVSNNKLYLSYDVEGVSVWHKDLTIINASGLTTSEPECTPNPVEMYYDNSTNSYDKIAYYKQRVIASTSMWITDAYQNRAELGTAAIEARNEPVVKVFSSRKPKLIVDISWYLNNMFKNHWLNWEIPVRKRTMSFGKTQYLLPPRADVYIVPIVSTRAERERIDPLLIGSAELSDGKIDGTFPNADDYFTQSVSVEFNDVAKQKLTTNPTNNPYYIATKSKAFDLFYCINMTDAVRQDDAFRTKWGQAGYYRNEIRLLENWQPDPVDPMNSAYNVVATYDLVQDALDQRQGKVPNPAHEAGPFLAVYSVELENAAANQPDAVPFKYRGCRTADKPLIVRVDRFKTAIQPAERVAANVPASARTHTGFSDEQKSGNASMSGSNDTGAQETCKDMTSQDIYCSNTSSMGGRTEGEESKPTLDLTSTIEHDEPEEDDLFARATMKFRGQMAGFSALDMSELAGAFGAGQVPGQSRKLTFGITPNWQNIENALNRADPDPTSEFDTGRFGEKDGIGYSLGYRTIVNFGPVPVFVTIKFTVGVSIGIELELAFAPDDDDAYECIGNSDCVVVETTPATYANAATECAEAGGTLAEMKTPQEATALRDALQTANVSNAWIGAQLAYDKASSSTEYRWLSSDEPFASNTQSTNPRYDTNKIGIANPTGLSSLGLTAGAISYTPGANRLTSNPTATTSLPYACALPYAVSEDYFSWSIGVPLGAGAGFGVEGCTPTADVGFCLSASLNVIDAQIKPTIGQKFRWLRRSQSDPPFSRNGTLFFEIPFKMSLFSGKVAAAIKIALVFFEFAIEWVIFEFDGITLLDAKLYEFETTVLEDY